MEFSLDFAQAFGEARAKVAGWIEGFVEALPNLIAAAVVVVVFWLLARAVRRLLLRVLHRFSAHHQVNRLVATIGRVVVIAAGLFVALGILGLDKALVSLLAGAGIIGLALGFAFQDTAENFIAGVLLSVRRPFTDGDIVQTKDFTGIVQGINLRATVLRSFDGRQIVVPNSEVFQNPLTNYSVYGARRVDVDVGISYGDDLEEARRVAVEAIEAMAVRDPERDVELFYEEFGGSSINFQLRFWIRTVAQPDYLAARSEAIVRIKRAFDDAGISIPFPVRTLDFGAVGGVTLGEALPASRSVG